MDATITAAWITGGLGLLGIIIALIMKSNDKTPPNDKPSKKQKAGKKSVIINGDGNNASTGDNSPITTTTYNGESSPEKEK